MLQNIISLSLLIIAVLVIRGIFRRSLPQRLIYGLWLVVVIKLCLPFSFFDVMLYVPDREIGFSEREETADIGADSSLISEDLQLTPVSPGIPEIDEGVSAPIIGDTDGLIDNGAQEEIPNETNSPSIAPIDTQKVSETEPRSQTNTADTVKTKSSVRLSAKNIVIALWIIGSAAVGLGFIISGVRFDRSLRADRIFYKRFGRVKVYIADNVQQPCLVGALPSIYITSAIKENDIERTVISHEYTHFLHFDHIWAMVRCAAVAIYWWNPLVWVAAILSKQDAELACDEALAKSMDKEARFAYAGIIVETAVRNSGFAAGFGSSPIKERIVMLTKKHKTRWICLPIALVLAAFAMGCAFMGKKEISYSVESYRSEHIVDDGYARSIEMIKIETNSKHEKAINEALTKDFDAVIDEYLSSAVLDGFELVIDSTYTEKNGILCMAGVAKIPHTYIRPLVARSVFLDLRRDALYTAPEYAELLGIDVEKALGELDILIEPSMYGDFELELDGMFYLEEDLIFIVYLTDLNEEGVKTDHHIFYNHTDGESYFVGYDFEGFEELEAALLKEKDSNMGEPIDIDGLPEGVSVFGSEAHITSDDGDYASIICDLAERIEENELGEINISALRAGNAVLDVYIEKYPGGREMRVTAVNAYGQRVSFDTSVDLYGNFNIDAFEADGRFVFSQIYFDVGETWIIGSDGVTHIDTTTDKDIWQSYSDRITRLVKGESGRLEYRCTPRKYHMNQIIGGILQFCTGMNDAYRELGYVTFDDGIISFVPTKFIQIHEVCDLEADFNELLEFCGGDVNEYLGTKDCYTLGDLFAYNLAHYGDLPDGSVISSYPAEIAENLSEDELLSLLGCKWEELLELGYGFTLTHAENGGSSVYDVNGVLGLAIKFTDCAMDESPAGQTPSIVRIDSPTIDFFDISIGMSGGDLDKIISEFDEAYADLGANRYYLVKHIENLRLSLTLTLPEAEYESLVAGLDRDEDIYERFSEYVIGLKSAPSGVVRRIEVSLSGEAELPEGVSFGAVGEIIFNCKPAEHGEALHEVIDMIANGELVHKRIDSLVMGEGRIKVKTRIFEMTEGDIIAQLYAVGLSAYGQETRLPEPLSLYGNIGIEAFNTDGRFVFSRLYYRWGRTYILSPDGVFEQNTEFETDPQLGDFGLTALSPSGVPYYNLPIVTYHMDEDGHIYYIRQALKYVNWQTVGGHLLFSCGGDELFRERGSVTFEGTAPVLHVVEKVSLEEAYGREKLEEWFDVWNESFRLSWPISEVQNANTVEELFEINRKHYEVFY